MWLAHRKSIDAALKDQGGVDGHGNLYDFAIEYNVFMFFCVAALCF